MSIAKRKSERAPTFYTEVSVDIEPSELEEAGWVYVGKGDEKNVRPDAVWIDLIRENHNDEHDGPMRWCQHTLCRAVER